MNAPECSGIGVGKEEIADFSVWFEFKDTFLGDDPVGRFGPLGRRRRGGQREIVGPCAHRGGPPSNIATT